MILSKIQRLQESMAVPANQDELVKVRHYFSRGLYCREMLMPAGTLVIGKTHKVDHLCLITKGQIQVVSEEAVLDIVSPYVYDSKKGAKRVILAITDSVWTTVHATELTDVLEIENTLVQEETYLIEE